MSRNNLHFYILVGDEETWKVSLTYNIWGFQERSKGLWNTCQLGDYLAFYAVKPIGKIIGFGIITRKFIDELEVFPDERLFHRSIWKYRFEFKKIQIIDDWKKGVSIPPQIMLNTGRKMIDEKTFMMLARKSNCKLD